MTSMKIVQFSRPPPPPCPSTSKIFPPTYLGRPISNEPLTSPNENQQLKGKHNPRMTIIYYISGPSFRSAFIFGINSLIFSGFLLTSFHLVEASVSAFSWLYTLVYAVVQKYHEMSFIHNYSHFQYLFCNQLVLFAQLESVNKLWNTNCTVHVKERN